LWLRAETPSAAAIRLGMCFHKLELNVFIVLWETVAVCYENLTEHINTLSAGIMQNTLKEVVSILTTRL
jgi:hypothetical protein